MVTSIAEVSVTIVVATLALTDDVVMVVLVALMVYSGRALSRKYALKIFQKLFYLTDNLLLFPFFWFWKRDISSFLLLFSSLRAGGAIYCLYGF